MVVSAIALAGGGARATAGSCGAFSGGLMALSAKFSPRSAELSKEELEELEKAKVKFYAFRDWFVSEFGSVTCFEMLRKLFGGSYNLASEESRKELKKVQDAMGFNCQVVTAKTVVKVAEMIL